MKTLCNLVAVAALAVSGAALAGKAQPSNFSGDSGNTSNSSLGAAVSTFAVTPSMASSIAAAPGAVQTIINGQNATVLNFSEGGQAYQLVVIDDQATVYKI